MYVTFKKSLNIEVYVSNKPCLYLFPCWHRFIYLFQQGLSILSIHLINILSFHCYVCYQMIHELFLLHVSVKQLLTIHV